MSAFAPHIFILFLTLLIGTFAGVSFQKRFRVSAGLNASYYICFVILLILALANPSSQNLSIPTNIIGYSLIYGAFLMHLSAVYKFLRITSNQPILNILTIMMGIFNIAAYIIINVIPISFQPLHGIIVFVCAIITFSVTSVCAYCKSRSGNMSARILVASSIFITLSSIVYGIAKGGMVTFPFDPYYVWVSGLIIQGTLLIVSYILHHYQPDHNDALAKAIEIQNIQTYERSKKARESIDQTRLIRVIEHEREIMNELRMREMVRTEEMRRAKMAADAANRAKSSFLAVISHEIRTPMNGVIGTLRMLKQTPLSEKQNELIETVHTSTDSMMVLINDILDFEKIEQGKMMLDIIAFDIHKLIDDVIKLMRGPAEQKGIKLMPHIDKNMPSALMGDPTRLRQVLLNLVSNAIKFTARGYVKINITLEDGPIVLNDKPASNIKISVEDTGIGIAQDALETLFDPFQQADNSITRQYGGTGLGLAICKNIVEAMDGKLRVESEVQKGSAFSFVLTFPHVSDVQTNKQKQKPSKIEQLRILIVEDNALNQKVLKEYLSKDEHNLTIVDNGEAAIRKSKVEQFDLVLTDINLYQMNGLRVAESIRALTNMNKDIPIIAITGDVSNEMMQKIKDSGMNASLRKPIDFDALHQILHDAVQHGKALDHFKEMPDTPKTNHQSSESFSGEKLFNMTVLNNFADTLGKNVIKDLFQGYQDKGSEIIHELKTYNSETPFITLQKKSHELRGMAANFGIHQVEKIAADIEHNAKDENMQTCLDRIQKLPDAHEKSVKQITLWLNEL